MKLLFFVEKISLKKNQNRKTFPPALLPASVSSFFLSPRLSVQIHTCPFINEIKKKKAHASENAGAI